MKKLLALAVVFGLVVGGAFAVDLSGEVIGTVNFLAGSDVKDSDIYTNAEFNRTRLEGSGGNDNFGGWIRVEGFDSQQSLGMHSGKGWEGSNLRPFNAHGLAWWKPIDQFKMSIGGNPDGIFGKEGAASWMFYQRASDTGVVDAGNAWGGGATESRHAFYGGFADNGLLFEIKPIDMLGINIVLPVFGNKAAATFDWGSETWLPADPENKTAGEVFGDFTAQLDLNLDFGNIALTFKNDMQLKGIDKDTNKNVSNLFVYFNLAAVENLSLDIGAGLKFDDNKDNKDGYPTAVGLAVKYDVSDEFGLKLRTTMEFGGKEKSDDAPFAMFVDLLPYYKVSDNVKIFCSLGIFMSQANADADAVTAFHVNPYVWIGEEWGPAFWVGLDIRSDGVEYAWNDNKTVTTWKVPMAIGLSF